MKRRSVLVASACLLFPGSLIWVASCSSSSSPPSLGGQLGSDGSMAGMKKDSGTSDATADGESGAEEGGDATADVEEAAVDAPDAPATPDGNVDSAAPVDAPVDEGTGASCMTPSQCNSGVCTSGQCASPSCTDGVQNGQETDVDCGGPTCNPCGNPPQTSGLEHCLLPRDCDSLVCSVATGDGGTAVLDDGGAVGQCLVPTCTDGVKNGTETDIDCGGGSCPACIIGKHCGANGDCVSKTCNGSNECACPAGMIQIAEADSNGGDYCIDPLEVTKAQYASFWAANPSLGAQPQECAWNDTYTPSVEWPPTLTQTGWNGGDPVRGVDWCDALDYCTWAGKRLCGQIGGGALSPTSYADSSKSEWFNACSSNGVSAYPYGSTYNPSPTVTTDAGTTVTSYVCNDISQPPAGGPGHTAPFVFTQVDPGGNLNIGMFSCQGGAPGIYNMSGDVAEWENSCSTNLPDAGSVDAGPNDTCLVRGGSYNADQSAIALSCNAHQTAPRNTTDPSIGFRCCL